MAIEKFRTRIFATSNLTVTGTATLSGAVTHSGAVTNSGTVTNTGEVVMPYGTVAASSLATDGMVKLAHVGGAGGTARIYFRESGTIYQLNLVAAGSVSWGTVAIT